MSDQLGKLLSLLNGFARIEPVLLCIHVAKRGPGSVRPAVHPATLLALDGGRAARLAGPGLGAAAQTGQHRFGIAGILVGHLLDMRFTGEGLREDFSTNSIGGSLE